MSKNIKKVIIVLIVLILIVVGASMFSGKTSQTPSLQSTTTGGTAAPLTQNASTSQAMKDTESINREFVSMLLNLQSIDLNDDIFSEPAFVALIDNTVRLNQPGNEGRQNPFAPIGFDSSVQTTSLEASVGNAVSGQTTDDTTTNNTETTNTETDLSSVNSSTELTPEQLQDALSNIGAN